MPTNYRELDHPSSVSVPQFFYTRPHGPQPTSTSLLPPGHSTTTDRAAHLIAQRAAAGVYPRLASGPPSSDPAPEVSADLRIRLRRPGL